MSRNTILHVCLFTIVFLFYTVSTLAMNLQGWDIIPFINTVAAIAAILCYCGWIFFLTPAGERVETTVRSSVSEHEATELLQKLKSVNQALGSSREQL